MQTLNQTVATTTNGKSAAKPVKHPTTLTVLSLGGGVQSSVLALMADQGLIDGALPDAAIHADTQSDPPETMAMVSWLAETVNYPVHVVTAGNIADDVASAKNTSGNTYVTIPAYTVNPDGTWGMGQRQCTREYKLAPIEKKQRELLGVGYRQRVPKNQGVEVWLGISTDEISRMKDNPKPWATNRWPLIEAGMSRQDCHDWWAEHAPVTAPELHRSACVICPYHNAVEWLDLQDRHPDLIAESAQIEADMQQNDTMNNGSQFFHRRRIPLLEAIDADRRSAEDRGEQLDLFDLFDQECEGMCGV